MFIAHVKQPGGCDYTIACGETVWRLKADTREAAIKEMKAEIIGELDGSECRYYEGHWDEHALSNVTLFEVSNEENIPVDEWYAEALKIVKDTIAELEEQADKAEFEQLKERYGDLNNV